MRMNFCCCGILTRRKILTVLTTTTTNLIWTRCTISKCIAEFRVKKCDLLDLAAAQEIPNQFVCHQRSVAMGMEGLCVLLWRLSCSCRYSDLIVRFGRPVPVISMVTNTVLDYIFTTNSQRILQWNQPILQLAQLQIHADAVSVKRAALKNCFGFINGTVQPIFRPGE